MVHCCEACLQLVGECEKGVTGIAKMTMGGTEALDTETPSRQVGEQLWVVGV